MLKRKKFITVVSIVLCLLLLNVSQVFAETTAPAEPSVVTETPVPTDPEQPLPDYLDPGILPDSPFYWISTLIQKIQVALTFDPAEKSALIQEQALEKLAESDEMIEQEKPDLAEEAIKQYTEKIEEAQNFLATLEDPTSEAAQKLQAALEQTNSSSIVVLGGLLEKLPPQAAQRVAVNIVKKMTKAIEKYDRKALKDISEELADEADQENLLNTDAESPDSEEVAKAEETSLVPAEISANSMSIVKDNKINVKTEDQKNIKEQGKEVSKEQKNGLNNSMNASKGKDNSFEAQQNPSDDKNSEAGSKNNGNSKK